MCSYVFRHGMTQCVFLLPLLWIYFLLLKRCFPHMHKFKILMWKGASVSQDVTFANGLFSYRHSIVTAGPIPMETKCHWKSNITQSGAMAQMRSGSDISDFLFHFCSPPHPHPRRPHKWFSARSNIWKGTSPVSIDDNCHGARWQPVAHYFSLKPDPCWDIWNDENSLMSAKNEMSSSSFQNRRGIGG